MPPESSITSIVTPTTTTGTTTQTATVTPVTTVEVKPTETKPDLLKRVSQKETVETPAAVVDEPMLNSGDIEKIQDPFAKKVVNDLYKHLQTGFNKKFTQLAEERKRLDLERQSQTSQPWTPERVREVTRDPNFVNAAKSVLQEQQLSRPPITFEGTQDDWSGLSEKEKQFIMGIDAKVNNLYATQDQMLVEQGDNQIKERFSDYDPQVVNTFQRDLQSGKFSPVEIRELVWKAKNFDRYLERSYHFGQEDRKNTLNEKFNGSTESGSSVQTTDERPTRTDGENPKLFLKRLLDWNYKRELAKRPNAKT